MPLYEYECDNGHRFEKIQKFSDPLVSVCPTCGSPVHKLMSSPAIQFKGSGWYITDYAKKEGTPAGKAGGSSSDNASDKGTEKTGEKSGEKSSETKSETAKSDSPATSASTPSPPSDSKKS